MEDNLILNDNHRSPHHQDEFYRNLQGFTLPDYTSPPLQIALDATHTKYKSDSVIDFGREMSLEGRCIDIDPSSCQTAGTLR